ncbi:hypothetical protein SORBI_3006G051750 [Sorghum bicolor]|uniref:Uncharacterized protein n=1 Tax=Sorghum bicolor TaxID=4558 RepID=A0A1Z5RCF6_SORBI|nr:hypothetical protein SORBI_3006G051750 [Sorghum bicolor]
MGRSSTALTATTTKLSDYSVAGCPFPLPSVAPDTPSPAPVLPQLRVAPCVQLLIYFGRH